MLERTNEKFSPAQRWKKSGFESQIKFVLASNFHELSFHFAELSSLDEMMNYLLAQLLF